MYSRRPQGQIGRWILPLLAFAVAGCASSSKILTDYDRDANFGAYNTYNFVEGAGPDYGQYQSLFTQFVIEAATVEMEKRGYTKADDPDLLVNFGAKLDDKIDVRTTSAPMTGGYYGYRHGGYGYGAWNGYGYATETHVSEYTEGTFNIDIIDNKRRQLVWEAVGRPSVSDESRIRNGKSSRKASRLAFQFTSRGIHSLPATQARYHKSRFDRRLKDQVAGPSAQRLARVQGAQLFDRIRLSPRTGAYGASNKKPDLALCLTLCRRRLIVRSSISLEMGGA